MNSKNTKLRFLGKIFTTVALTCGSVVSINQPSYAEGANFFCEPAGITDNYPRTIAKTPRGKFQIIEWQSYHFQDSTNTRGEEYEPETRCNDVSRRFEDYYRCGLLNPDYIGGATINWITNGEEQIYPAVLIVKPEGSICSLPAEYSVENSTVTDVLFMLPPERDFNSAAARLRDILERLEEIRYDSGSPPIEPIVN